VSDYEIPGQNGIQFLDTVREDHPELPFILFTGKGSEAVASEAIARGVTDYLQKDSGVEQFELLANRIRNAVSQYRTAREAEEQKRLLAIIQELNQALVKATDRDEIETVVTDIFTSAEPYKVAWIADYDTEQDRLDPQAVAGVDEGVLQSTTVEEKTPTEEKLLQAIREGGPVIVREHEPPLSVWSEASPVETDDATAITPISYQDELYGILAVHTDRPEFFDDVEREMLDEIAGDIAVATHAAETRRTLGRHKSAVEAVPEGVFVLDENATILLANESIATLVDRPREEIRDESFLTFVEEGVFDETIVDWYGDAVRGLLSSSTDRNEARTETEISLPDGETRIIEIHLTLRPYEEKFRGTVGILRDVTAAKQREQTLTENKERYRRLVENAPVPIVLYDEEGTLRFVNDATVDFLGASDSTSVIGRPATEFVHPDDTDLAEARMRQVIQERETLSAAELSLVDENGERKKVILASVPITYHGERAAQVVIEDITELKERERALQRERNRFEEFASIVSHDLRNPLNVARGRLSLLEEEVDSDHIEALDAAHERMETLIEDVLTFARLGERALDEDTITIRACAESCWRTVESPEAMLVVRTEGSIRGDLRYVQQLLENLFRNAIEHGGESVTITVGELADGTGFYVADDGGGIPDAAQGNLFESGFSTKEAGTGFGLEIVREIVDAHGWTIEVTDSAEGGARFEIADVPLEA
jgi:PAS domain S-box-containing protein